MKSTKFIGWVLLSLAPIGIVCCGPVSTALGELLLHEPFAYASGQDLTGLGNVGSGMTGTWTAVGNISDVFVLDGTGAEIWDGQLQNLATSGNFAGLSVPTGDHIHTDRQMASSVTDSFVDGSTTWLSVAFARANSAGAHFKPMVAIGADRLSTDRGNTAKGPAIGAGALYNDQAIRAQYWLDEDASGTDKRHASGTTLGSSNEQIIVAKIEWGSGGSDDTITVRRFNDGDTLSETTFDSGPLSSISADLDQSTFDTISFAGSRYHFDEVRLATTFDEVISGTFAFDSTEWLDTAGGNWQAGSWSAGLPSTTLPAVFGSNITQGSTVYTDEDVSVGSIEFDNAFSYAIAGTGTLTVDTDIVVLQGDHELQVPLLLTSDLNVTVADGASLTMDNLDLGGFTLTQIFTGTGTGILNINSRVTGGGTIIIPGATAASGPQSVPEPGSLVLLILGTLALAPVVRRRRKT